MSGVGYTLKHWCAVHSGRRHYRKGEINYLVGFDTLFWLISEALK